jgi:uncharacterized phiE125 gp8 family phage protein
MHKIVTAVVNEPITLADVKIQLNRDLTQSIGAGTHPVSTINGIPVEVYGSTPNVVLNAGLAVGTLNVHIEESDDGVTFTDFTGGAFTAVNSANDYTVYEKSYTGVKRYIRAVAAITVGVCDFAVSVIKDAVTGAEDASIEAAIKAAREFAEDMTWRAMATQTFDMWLDRFPVSNEFSLDMGPVQSVTSIKYKNSAGVETTMTPTTQYIADTDRTPARIVLPYGVTWPAFIAYPVNPITVRYVAGYTTDIPETFRRAMIYHAAMLYRFRDEAIPQKEMDFIIAMYRTRKAGWL